MLRYYVTASQQHNCQHNNHELPRHDLVDSVDGNESIATLDARYARVIALWNNGHGPRQQMRLKCAYRAACRPPSKLGEAKQAMLHEDTFSIDVTPPPSLAQLKVSSLVRDARKSGQHPEVRIPLKWQTLVDMIGCRSPAKWHSMTVSHCVPTRMGVTGVDGVEFALEMWAVGQNGIETPLHPVTQSIWTGPTSLYRFPCGPAEDMYVPLKHDAVPYTHVASQFSMPARQVLTEEEFVAWASSTRAMIGQNLEIITCDLPSKSQVYISDLVTRCVYAHADLLHQQWEDDGYKEWNWQGTCPTTGADATMILCSSYKIREILCGRYGGQVHQSDMHDAGQDQQGQETEQRVHELKNRSGVTIQPGDMIELRIKDTHQSLFAYDERHPNAHMQLSLSVAMAYVAHGDDDRGARNHNRVPDQMVQMRPARAS
jgi:hypothetical protein